LAWLENDGMGVCGYTFDEVSAMPIDALARAITARNKFVNAILRAALGGDEPAPVAAAARPMTPALFDAVFGGAS
jgi:hypothetical protein